MSEEMRAAKAAKNRKDWVKNVAIIFLSLMLVLTLFSNTFMNYSLPEVSTQYVMPGTITSKVRGTGIISASDPYSVVLNETRKVAGVLIRPGDVVEKDQVLLILEETESEELKAAEKLLEQLIGAYESGIIAGGIPAEDVYAAQNGTGGTFAQNLERLAELERQIEAAEQQIVDCDKQIVEAYKQRDEMAASLGVTYSDEYMEMIRNEMATLEYMSNHVEEYVAAYDAAVQAYEQAVSDLEAAQGQSADALAGLQEAVARAAAERDRTQAEKLQAESAEGRIGYRKQALKMEEFGQRVVYLEKVKADAEETIVRLNEEMTELRMASSNIQSLTAQLKEIEEQRSLVEELKAKQTDAQVKAPVSGTVTSINYRSGETIDAGATVATIQLSGKECTMTMSVTTEQAATLRVGDVADIQNAWYYSGVTAVLTAIRVDPANPQTNRLLVFRVMGDVMDGQSLSISVGQKSAEYSYTVPNSAVREDNNGKFILIVEYRQSPLGTRYVATRVDVEVLASDENSSAISGLLNGYEYVITTASKPVAPGQLIRLSE